MEKSDSIIEALEKASVDKNIIHLSSWTNRGILSFPLDSELTEQSNGGNRCSHKSVISGHLQKTRDFGSISYGDTYHQEFTEFNSLKKNIKRLTCFGLYPISIMVNTLSNKPTWINEVADVRFSLSKKGNPSKCDFELLNKQGEIVCRISHKYGDSPSDFRQWSGTREVLSKPEIVYFGKELKSHLAFVSDFEDGPTNNFPSYTFGKRIKDAELKRYALFGHNEVDLILQGKISFQKCPTSDTFSNKTSTLSVTLQASLALSSTDSIEDLPDNYQPTLMAFTGSDRAAFGIPGCRLAIYPYGGRKITKEFF